MMKNLSRLDPSQLNKVHCFDADATEIDRRHIVSPPDVCFIDGEHTDEAVIRDYSFVSAVCAPDAVIYFHDAPIIHGGLAAIVRELKAQKTMFRAYKLKGSTFAIMLARSPATSDRRMLRLAHSGQLFLTLMRTYQHVSELVPPSVARRVRDVGKRLFG